MNDAIKQAIEALELAARTSYSETNQATFDAAIAALRVQPDHSELSVRVTSLSEQLQKVNVYAEHQEAQLKIARKYLKAFRGWGDPILADTCKNVLAQMKGQP